MGFVLKIEWAKRVAVAVTGQSPYDLEFGGIAPLATGKDSRNSRRGHILLKRAAWIPWISSWHMSYLLRAILDEEEAIDESNTGRATSKVPTPFDDNVQLNSL